MRIFCFILLVLFLGAVAVFAVQNDHTVPLKFIDQSLSYPLSLVIGAVYLLGMLSGWTVVGFLKRSFHRATDRPENRG